MDLTASPKVLETSEGTFHAKTVVLATGANPRELGLPYESALTGRGVAYCAACDGMRYKGKTVVVVGGGNSAAADAMLLSRIAQKVILVHRRDTLRATKIYHEPLMQAENLEFRWNSVVTELLHEDKLTGIKLKNVDTGEEDTIPCDGVFISVGQNSRYRTGAGAAGSLDRQRLHHCGRNHRNQPPRCLCRRRCADKAPAPGGHGSSRRSHGSPHGGGVPGGRILR